MKRIFFIMIIILFGITSSNASIFIDDKVAQNNSALEDNFDDEFDDAQKVYDPLINYNQTMTSFNDIFYMNVLQPVAKTYANVVHENIRIGVSNVYTNLLFPIRFVNNILQLKFMNASEELGRFIINSTFGLLGIMDLGPEFNLKPHKEDFGQTLGFYGVGSGFHIVIPFLGPSNIRDLFGFVTDSYVNPMTTSMLYEPYQIPNNELETIGIKAYEIVNTISLHIEDYEVLKRNAVDLYPFLRDIYEQRRKKLIEE